MRCLFFCPDLHQDPVVHDREELCRLCKCEEMRQSRIRAIQCPIRWITLETMGDKRAKRLAPRQ